MSTDSLDNIDIVIDDISTGNLDNYLIYLLWKHIKKVNSKLILLGSTIDIRQFPDAYTINVETNSYPVNIRYHDRNYEISDMRLIHDTVLTVLQFYKVIEGNIMIFVATEFDVLSMLSKLKDEKLNAVSLLDYRSGNRTENRKENRDDIGNGDRRAIIVLSQLYENALFMLPNVSLVIDTMMTEHPLVTMSGMIRGSIRITTKDEAALRSSKLYDKKGGMCYRMCTSDFYSIIPQSKVPEIMITPLEYVVLQFVSTAADPYILSEQARSDIISFDEIKNKIKIITRLGLFSGSITHKGKFALSVPLSIKSAAILWTWIEAKLPLFPILSVLSLIDNYGPSYYWYPPRARGQTTSSYTISTQEHLKIFFRRFYGNNDLETMLTWWNDLLSVTGSLEVPTTEISVWARNNGMAVTKIKEVVNHVLTLIKVMSDKGYNIEVGPFNPKNTVDILRPILADVYRDKHLKLDRGTGFYKNVKGYSYLLDELINVSTILSTYPEFLISLVDSSANVITDNYQVGIAVDIPEDMLPTQTLRSYEKANIIRRVKEAKSREVRERGASKTNEYDNINISLPHQDMFAQVVSTPDKLIYEEIGLV